MTAFRCMLCGVVVTLALGCASMNGGSAPPALESDDDKTLYSLGLALARNLEPFGLTEAELPLVMRGVSDGVFEREPEVRIEEWAPRFSDLAQSRQESIAQRERDAAAAFVVAMAAEEGAVTTESGLVFKEIEAGEGASPGPEDTVRVHYQGTLRTGRIFDSSIQRDTPALVPLARVIPCWSEAVQRMKVGGKAKVTCPPDLAYGDQGMRPAIKPGAALSFDVELLEIVENPPPLE